MAVAETNREFVDKGTTGVTATTELLGRAHLSSGSLFNEEGTALELPARVHLENAFLGSECYIGSSAHPVTVDFTTGTTSPPTLNKPIKGSRGTLEVKGEGNILLIKGNSLVNNSFAAPEAEGCGGSSFPSLSTPPSTQRSVFSRPRATAPRFWVGPRNWRRRTPDANAKSARRGSHQRDRAICVSPAWAGGLIYQKAA